MGNAHWALITSIEHAETSSTIKNAKQAAVLDILQSENQVELAREIKIRQRLRLPFSFRISPFNQF